MLPAYNPVLLLMTQSISYRQVRSRYSLPKIARANLIWAACLIWGVFIAAGGADPVNLAGAVTMSIAPLIGAWQAPLYFMPAWLLGHAVILFLVLVAMRHVIWPIAWHKTEWALPIEPKQRLVADALLVSAASLPILVLYVSGLVGFLRFAVPKATITMVFGTTALLLASIAISLIASLAYLHQMRKAIYESSVAVNTTGAKKQFIAPALHRSVWVTLILAPIIDGTAPRTRQLWFVSVLMSLALLVGMIRQPQVASYWLAAFSVLLMTSATLLRKWIEIELSTMHDATIHYPIAPQKLVFWRKWVPMASIVTCLALLMALTLVFLTASFSILILYVLLALALSAVQIWYAPKASDVATMGWFVSVVTLIVLGSRVLK